MSDNTVWGIVIMGPLVFVYIYSIIEEKVKGKR